MLGVDLSNNNGHVNIRALVSDGIGFVHAKATESNWFIDQLFKDNRTQAAACKIPFGPYHFANPKKNPGAQGATREADFFCSVIGSALPGSLRPVLDLEQGSGDLTIWAGAFLARVESRLKVRPMLYSYTGFINQHIKLKSLPGYYLWLADYGPNDGREHAAGLPNQEHQFTSRAVLSGVVGRLDENDAPSLAPLLVPRATVQVSDKPPLPEPKNGTPFTNKLWPVPIPHWFWTWAQWRQDGQSYARPLDAPELIPPWAWLRLKAL